MTDTLLPFASYTPEENTVFIIYQGDEAYVFSAYNEDVIDLCKNTYDGSPHWDKDGKFEHWSIPSGYVPELQDSLTTRGMFCRILKPTIDQFTDIPDEEEATKRYLEMSKRLDFALTPFEWEDLYLLLRPPHQFYVNDVGFGKTAVSCMAANVLGQRNLVIADRHLLNETWRRHLIEIGEDPDSIVVVEGSVDKKLHLCYRNAKWLLLSKQNFWDHPYIDVLSNIRFDVWLADESYGYKDPRAHRTKATLRLKFRKLVEISAWPTVHGSLELQPQLRLIDFSKFGDREAFIKMFVNTVYITKWKESAKLSYWERKHVIDRRGPMSKVRIRVTKGGIKNEKLLREMLQPHLILRLKEDYDEYFPRIIPHTTELDMLPLQKQLYDGVLEQSMIDIGDSSSLTSYMMLSMIACSTGLIEGQPDVSCKREYLDAVLPKLSKHDGRSILIWCSWVDGILLLQQHLKKKYRTWVVYGKVPVEERYEIIREWGKTQGGVLIANPSASGRGPDYIPNFPIHVFWVSVYGPEAFLQAQGRVSRLASHVEWAIHEEFLCAKGSVDENMARKLKLARRAKEALGEARKPEIYTGE